MLSFTIFDSENSVELKEGKNTIRIEKIFRVDDAMHYFKIVDNGKEIAKIDDLVILGVQEIKTDRTSSLEDLEDIMLDISPVNKRNIPKTGSGLELDFIPHIRDTFQPPDFGITVLGSSHGNFKL